MQHVLFPGGAFASVMRSMCHADGHAGRRKKISRRSTTSSGALLIHRDYLLLASSA
jgi:hypothetical protein